MRSVAVVGAGLAGLSAARALRQQGFDGRLTLIGDEAHRPYDRPPLSKEFLAGACTEADLALAAEPDDLGAEWLLGVRAAGLDRRQRTVLLDDGRAVPADGVVIATGAAARSLPGLGDAAGVHTLRTLDDARALRADLSTASRLVVVGAGFIGAEVAATARGRGLEVTVIEAAETPLAGPLGTAMGAVVSQLHADHGVRLICGRPVEGLTGGDRVDGVRLADGTRLPADVVLIGIGARPGVDWLDGGELSVGDGVRCDAAGRTGAPGVVAVGDCAAWLEPRLGRHLRVEHWTAAAERPRIAVRALLTGVAPTSPARLPYFWSDQYGLRIQFAGHTRDGDEVTVEEGAPERREFLAVYRRAGRPVAVLGVDQVGPFTRWRRQLERAGAEASQLSIDDTVGSAP